MSTGTINRTSAAPFVPKSQRSLARSAPELWAEQERRRKMLEAQDVVITYRPATALPPTGELARIVMSDDKLQTNEPRELRFITETWMKLWLPARVGYRRWFKEEGPRVMELLRDSPCYVADVGGGVVLGFVVSQGDLVHALYVKSDFRGLGIGLGLLREAGVTLPIRCNRVTNSWRHWAKGHGIQWEPA